MIHLLFPGRHLVNTRFQADYLERLLVTPPGQWPGLVPGRCALPAPPHSILFALTSANQEYSRFNPVPFHVRAMGVDRFARDLRQRVPFQFRVFGIPHYGHTPNFAAFTVKEIAHQSEQAIQLTPANCVVLCSTPEVVRLYQALGFTIAPAEAAEPESRPATPIEIIREIGAAGDHWAAGPLVRAHLAASHRSLFEDLPEVPQRIARLYRDPLTTQEGSLTGTRNYSTYARGMNEIIRLKYLDIRAGIRPGRIAEFLSKKDYADNWRSEMNEEFCFWGFAQWKAVLTEIGFHLLENPNHPAEGSRAYTNPWVVQHRYEGHVALFRTDGQPLPWPATNLVLFAEKRRAV